VLFAAVNKRVTRALIALKPTLCQASRSHPARNTRAQTITPDTLKKSTACMKAVMPNLGNDWFFAGSPELDSLVPKNGDEGSDAGGIEAYSRWLSVATPPERSRKQEHPGWMQDPQHLPSTCITQMRQTQYPVVWHLFGMLARGRENTGGVACAQPA
jgi:hypothetical protein